MRRRSIPLALSALALGSLHQGAGSQSIPMPPPDGSRPAGAAFPAFDQIGIKIQTEYPDVESIAVVRKGRVLFEHHNSSPDTLRDVQSVTKSVLSLAVGAAVSRGALASLDQSVEELLGAAGKAGAASLSPTITIRHLLTMTAGFRVQERFASGTADDPAFLLQRERAEPPGTVFAYDNLSANLLSVALEAATGHPSLASRNRLSFGLLVSPHSTGPRVPKATLLVSVAFGCAPETWQSLESLS